MNNIVRIVYIDDVIDTVLTDYMDQTYNDKICDRLGVRYLYEEFEFKPEMQYSDLLNNEKIRSANILIMDSRLFSNNNCAKKYKGEEIELLVREIYPFIEVIVITQNDIKEHRDILEKFASISEMDTCSAFNHYEKELGPIIFQKTKSVMSHRYVAMEFEENKVWDKLTKEKIKSSLSSTSVYEELTKKDIDRLVESFTKIENLLSKDHQ